MTETQNGFLKGRSCTDLIFGLKLLTDKRSACSLKTHLFFVDYKKACDSIQSEVLLDILTCRNIPDTLLKAIVDMYSQNKILVKFNSKLSKLDEN